MHPRSKTPLFRVKSLEFSLKPRFIIWEGIFLYSTFHFLFAKFVVFFFLLLPTYLHTLIKKVSVKLTSDLVACYEIIHFLRKVWKHKIKKYVYCRLENYRVNDLPKSCVSYNQLILGKEKNKTKKKTNFPKVSLYRGWKVRIRRSQISVIKFMGSMLLIRLFRENSWESKTHGYKSESWLNESESKKAQWCGVWVFVFHRGASWCRTLRSQRTVAGDCLFISLNEPGSLFISLFTLVLGTLVPLNSNHPSPIPEPGKPFIFRYCPWESSVFLFGTCELCYNRSLKELTFWKTQGGSQLNAKARSCFFTSGRERYMFTDRYRMGVKLATASAGHVSVTAAASHNSKALENGL